MLTGEPSPSTAQKIPSLDGFRALSILVVMASHSGLQDRIPGVFGVTVFFFISGFLITTLLTDEYKRSGTIAVGAFYMRRFLRLFPPLFVFVALTGAVWVAMGERLHPLGVLGALAYMTNYLVIYVPHIMQGIGGQLWSLAVEEHFYLFFPWLVLFLLPRRRMLVPALVGLCIASLAVRIGVALAAPEAATQYNGIATEARMDAILYGALAAILRDAPQARSLLERLTRPYVVVVALAILLTTFLIRDPFFRSTVRYTIQSLTLVPPILALTSTNRFPVVRRLLDSWPFVTIGVLSYSLYLWHLAGLELGNSVAMHLALPAISGWVLGWVITFGAAALSYRFVERPFFSLRRRFGSRLHEQQATAPALATPNLETIQTLSPHTERT
ncbi:acyltransferase (plasmid) [Phyllobacteriaceae bacterium JZ32]